MLKKLVAASALAIGTAALVATPASADSRFDYDPRFVTDMTERYVSAFDPAAYGSRSGDPMIISPYGTNQPIYCFSFKGAGHCWQVDPSGVERDLTPIVVPTGSSAGDIRGISIYNPF